MSSALDELQAWYLAHCDGEWEHRYGVSIGNIDNPGWMFSVDLADTELADVPFAELRENYDDERDWLICGKHGATFSGNGGPLMLERLIRVFLGWARASAGQGPRGA